MSESIYSSASPKESGEATTGNSTGTIYRVVFEGIKPTETTGSFAIKYGILTSTPVTKIKFMLRNLPKTLLETKNGPKARSTLKLIDEAGGVGRIEDFNQDEAPKVEIPEEKPAVDKTGEKSCLKCGFPIKDSDEYCQFCHSPLVETKSEGIKTIMKAGGGGALVSPKRLMIYIVLFLVAMLWIMLST